VSWNGSTLVHKWEVLGSKTKTGHFTKLALHGWSSFETKIETGSMSYFKVEALDSHGHVLPHGTSGVVSGP